MPESGLNFAGAQEFNWGPQFFTEYPEFSRENFLPALEILPKLRTGDAILIKKPNGDLDLGVIRDYTCAVEGVNERDEPVKSMEHSANIFYEIQKMRAFLSSVEYKLTAPEIREDKQAQANLKFRDESLRRVLNLYQKITIEGISYNKYVRKPDQSGKGVYNNTNKTDQPEQRTTLTAQELVQTKIKRLGGFAAYAEAGDQFIDSTIETPKSTRVS